MPPKTAAAPPSIEETTPSALDALFPPWADGMLPVDKDAGECNARLLVASTAVMQQPEHSYAGAHQDPFGTCLPGAARGFVDAWKRSGDRTREQQGCCTLQQPQAACMINAADHGGAPLLTVRGHRLWPLCSLTLPQVSRLQFLSWPPPVHD